MIQAGRAAHDFNAIVNGKVEARRQVAGPGRRAQAVNLDRIQRIASGDKAGNIAAAGERFDGDAGYVAHRVRQAVEVLVIKLLARHDRHRLRNFLERLRAFAERDRVAGVRVGSFAGGGCCRAHDGHGL
ncbi:hypothetical protein D3C86_1191130 [compost metagenome]